MTDPTPIPIRPRTERRRGPLIAAGVIALLGLLGVVATTVLITLFATGQIV